LSIPLVDLKAQYRNLRAEMEPVLAEVLNQAHFIMGPNAQAFEQEFAAYCGARYAIGCGSGTDALIFAIQALGIGVGDEVITTPHTFIASAECISLAGATPVFVDIDPRTYSMDPNLIEEAITERTRAIVVVHLYGNPAPMDKIMAIAKKHGLVVVEDCAQAHGATFQGQRLGTFGDIACFSFYPGKNLGAYGDGGAVVTNRTDLADRVFRLRNHGRAPGAKYEHSEVGYCSRLDEVQAAVLRVKLRHLDAWNKARRAVARQFSELLQGADVILPMESQGGEAVYHLYVVRVRNREEVQAQLRAEGIECGVHYPVPLHLQPAYANLGYLPGKYPMAEVVSKEVLSLPIFPEITKEQIITIVTAVRRHVGG
jgi:dTDP-4-amino-4,6-dideoxygalactose transaminase